MPKRNRRSKWYILLLISLLIFLIAACGSDEEETPTSPEGAPETEVTAEAGVEAELVTPTATAIVAEGPTATPQPAAVNQAPLTLQLEADLSPALDPTCLEGKGDFSLQGASLPESGLQPGITYLFCATGAPKGATVEYFLVNPAGGERKYESVSFKQDKVTVAPLSIRLAPDDAPGDWKLIARYGEDGAEATLDFKVLPPSQPFIALNEPIGENTTVIRAGIGGLPPESTARFALYSLTDPRTATGAAAQNDGILLISTRLVADSMGRADLELDVADLPAGPYLLLLIPPGTDLGNPPTLRLPDQEPLVIAANITRSQQVAAAPEGSASEGTPAPPADNKPAIDETPPSTLEPANIPANRPPTLQTSIHALELPECVAATTPTLQLTPEYGEIGNWWLGCASGFAPNETISFTVTMPNGEKTQFPILAGADGAAPFRWYSSPGEGEGTYSAVATAPSGQADISWNINPATRPHVLVFPHEFKGGVPAQLYLSGFSGQQEALMAIYRLDGDGQGEKVRQWKTRTSQTGTYEASFARAAGLPAGQYAIVVASKPAYNLPGVDAPISAIDFFSIGTSLDPRYDAYTLNLGRTSEVLVAEAPEPEATEAPTAAPTAAPTEEPAAAETPEVTPEATAEPAAVETPAVAAEVPPKTVTIAEDTSPAPTCPGATPGEATICVLPTSLPQGTYVYMLMHDFKRGTRFRIDVVQPNGARVKMQTRANSDGFADAHWYTLNGEQLGEYTVRIRGGGEDVNETFTVVEPSSPHLVIQPRSPKRRAQAFASVTGFEPRETLLLAGYLGTGTEDGKVNFELIGTSEITTDANGGGTLNFRANKGRNGDLLLIQVYRPGTPEVLAQEVYQIAQPLYLRYPFAWGQNFQEGQ